MGVQEVIERLTSNKQPPPPPPTYPPIYLPKWGKASLKKWKTKYYIFFEANGWTINTWISCMAMESLTCIQCMQHHRQVARNTSLPGTSLKVKRLKTTDAQQSHDHTESMGHALSWQQSSEHNTQRCCPLQPLARSAGPSGRLAAEARLESSKRCPPSTKLSGHKMFSHLHWTFLLQIKTGVCSFSFFEMQCVIMCLMWYICIFIQMFNFLDKILFLDHHLSACAEKSRSKTWSISEILHFVHFFSTNNSKTLLPSKGIHLPTKINQSTKASTLSEERAPTERRQLPDTTLTSLHKGPAFSNHIQTHKTFKTMLIYCDTDTQSAHFQGNPLCHATKWHLNDS